MAEIRLTVVSNSSPLIYLAKIGKLNLIKDVYGKTWIPEAVFDEAVTHGKALGITDASIIDRAVGNWIIREKITPRIASEYGFLDQNERLGLGEREALKLCKQLGADLFIADDKEARRVARLLKIKPIGTLGVLIQAHRRGLISTHEASETLDNLIRAHFRIEPNLYRRVMKELTLIP